MKNTKHCPKCSSQKIVRVPDNQNRHASGNTSQNRDTHLADSLLYSPFLS